MPDELEYPTDDEKSERYHPKVRYKETNGDQQYRQSDHRNTETVSQPVDRVLVPLGVFFDPLVPRFTAKHNLVLHFWLS